MDDEFGKVLRLATGCDPTALQIDPAEGFLLSRVDGSTPWRVLREMGAMPPEEVDLCLEGWLARGVLVVDEERTGEERTRRENRRREPPKRCAAATADAIPTEFDESAIDSGLDIGIDVQRRVLEFELGLGGAYHEILGVAKDADAKTIKRAYFKLSKEFHPDRFFRREIGDFARRLDRIFKKVTEAYELLSDPTTRAEVERSMQAPAPPPPPTEASTGSGAPPRPMTRLERLRARMPRIPEAVLAERRRKARDLFTAARLADRRGAHSEAAASVRLAIAFDPFEEEYKLAFGDLQARASETRAKKLLANTDELASTELREALRLLEDVLLYRPHDPEVADRAACVALELDQVDKAREYVERAVEHSPEVAAYHLTLARVHEARKERGHAVRELEKAVQLDPSNQDARRLLTTLRPRNARAGGGS